MVACCYITADARDQTEYGTVRGYIAVGISTNEVFDPAQTFNANRAFIQWAGFTFGRAQSFFDFFSQAAIGYLGFTPNSDTGDGGWDVLAYTAQFGNGFSGTLSLETRRTTQIIGQGVPTLSGANVTRTGFFTPGVSTAPNAGTINGAPGAAPGAGVAFTQAIPTAIGYGGWQVPDIVANLRVDQAWGSAAIAGALHEVNANYYINSSSVVNPEGSGHPDDKWGWAAMAGLRLNAPFIGTGDYLQLQAIYTQGALRYLFQNPNNNWWIQNGFNTAYGVLSDGVYGGTSFFANGSVLNNTATSINLTTAWGVNAGYEHFWTPRWRTSRYGGYTSVRYNGQANAILCTLQGSGVNGGGGAAAGIGVFATAGVGCDNNWTSWWIGSRTQWNVTKDFYLGLDVAYLKVNGMDTTTGTVLGTAVTPNAVTTNFKTVGDENIWMARFRVHRDFYP